MSSSRWLISFAGKTWSHFHCFPAGKNLLMSNHMYYSTFDFLYNSSFFFIIAVCAHDKTITCRIGNRFRNKVRGHLFSIIRVVQQWNQLPLREVLITVLRLVLLWPRQNSNGKKYVSAERLVSYQRNHLGNSLIVFSPFSSGY